jgi:hypothetical protein
LLNFTGKLVLVSKPSWKHWTKLVLGL